MVFATWMASVWGRVARIIAGLVLIAIGLYLQNTWGIVIIIVGALTFFPALALGPLLDQTRSRLSTPFRHVRVRGHGTATTGILLLRMIVHGGLCRSWR